MKIAVIFYSRSGNTKFVAEEISANLGAELKELLDQQDRRGILGYLKSGRDSLGKKQTQLLSDLIEINKYDLIFIGCPVWAYNLPPALRTFLSANNLSGKKVVLFCTQSSAGAEGVFKSMRELIPDAEIIGTRFFNKVLPNKDKVKEEIHLWMQSYIINNY